jgi:hypothetical protein
MQKITLILVVLAVIIIILSAVVLWPTGKPAENNVENPQNNTVNNQQRVEGIQVSSPISGAEVSLPIKITGSVNGGGWIGFEGQVGTVELLDNKGNSLAKGILTATTDWMKPPVQFEATISSATYKGPATLLFSNENPSGDLSKDKKFGLPVVIK